MDENCGKGAKTRLSKGSVPKKRREGEGDCPHKDGGFAGSVLVEDVEVVPHGWGKYGIICGSKT